MGAARSSGNFGGGARGGGGGGRARRRRRTWRRRSPMMAARPAHDACDGDPDERSEQAYGECASGTVAARYGPGRVLVVDRSSRRCSRSEVVRNA